MLVCCFVCGGHGTSPHITEYNSSLELSASRSSDHPRSSRCYEWIRHSNPRAPWWIVISLIWLDGSSSDSFEMRRKKHYATHQQIISTERTITIQRWLFLGMGTVVKWGETKRWTGEFYTDQWGPLWHLIASLIRQMELCFALWLNQRIFTILNDPKFQPKMQYGYQRDKIENIFQIFVHIFLRKNSILFVQTRDLYVIFLTILVNC